MLDSQSVNQRRFKSALIGAGINIEILNSSVNTGMYLHWFILSLFKAASMAYAL
jgi:hypothetical protein